MSDLPIGRLRVRVDEVPDPRLLPNNKVSGRHKRAIRAALRKRTKAAVEDCAASEGWKLPTRIGRYDLDLTIYWPSSRVRPDTDGALSSCKGLLDGIADAIGVDDRLCDTLAVRQRKLAKGEEGYVVATFTFYAF